MEDLYATKAKEEKEGTLHRCYCLVKEYCGALPVSGGVLTAGLSSTAAYVFGTADSLVHQQLALSWNPADVIYQIYANFSSATQRGEVLAGSWAKTGFVAGQFLTYVLKRKISSALKSRLAKRIGEHND